jgi:transcriptional regulator with XRE-family HTH domain
MARLITPLFPREQLQAKELGGRLRQARLRRRISLTDLAARVGVNRMTQRRLENGDLTVSVAVLIRTLTVLGLAQDLDGIASIDDIGHRLADAGLPERPRQATTRPSA